MSGPSPIDLTTLAEVKAYLNVTGTTADVLLQSLITAVSQAMMNYCNRTFQLQSYTETRDATGNTQWVMLNYPIVSVTSVSVNGNTIPPSTGFNGGGYGGRSGYYNGVWSVMIDGYCVPRGRRNVMIAYTAGYATIPADLDQACIETVALKYKQKDRIGISGSEGIDGQHITYKDLAMSSSVILVLNQYKRVIQVTQ